MRAVVYEQFGPPSRRGREHNQAVLARRQVNVMWALLRDDRLYTLPQAA